MLSKLLFSVMAANGKKTLSKLDEVTKKPLENNLDTLFTLLNENKDTDYGRRYDFASIRTIEDFKAKVPFSNYDTYAEYIEQMKNGAGNLITKESPVYFAATSGSVANPKAIPVSEKSRTIYKDYTSGLCFAVIAKHFKGGLKKTKALNLVEVRTSSMPCGTLYGAVSGMATANIKNLLPFIFTTPLACTFPTEKFDSSYVHLRFALIYKRLNGITAAFMSAIADIIRYMEENWELLVDDIEKGTINDDINLSPALRAELLKKIKPNPKRAAELRQEFKKGFGDDVLKRVWPDLQYIYSIGSAGFASYTQTVRKYVGEIGINYSSFAASEALMAICTEMNDPRYTLLPDSAFFEFIPHENCDEENPDTLTIDQLEVGEKYEIVLTTPSGFYRYRIQDVVEVVGMQNNTPQIQFAYRLKQMVNMAGEKTNDGHFRWAAQQCSDAFDCHITEYAAFPKEDELRGRYEVLVEVDRPDKVKPRLDELSKVMSEKLSVANPSLGSKIESGLLEPVHVNLVQQETFALYRDLMVMRGISPNQIKPIRIIDTPEKERFFFGLLDRED